MSPTMDHMATAIAVKRSYAGPPASSRNAHLTKSQVRMLWDAGSFLVQEYGILLNTRIVINHTRLSTCETKESTQLVSALVHELGMALKRSHQDRARIFIGCMHMTLVGRPASRQRW